MLNAKISEIKNKIPSIINLAINVSLNVELNEVKNEIPSITNVLTTTAPTAVENRIPNVSDLVKKADYDAEIKGIKNKSKKLVNESGWNEKLKASATKYEIKKLATKAEFKAKQDKVVKLKTYYLSLKVTFSIMESDFN